ncbi:MAG TPA: cytochrome d ubiquinol oxidase subunit II, partial [Polyangiaceae bacterium]|nr:cytochrome d ubiquinol oxidase subunit II [Polyangiaceae bacterium]
VATMLAATVLYFLFGGADFGGGVWDLLAAGPRRKEQRALIEQAIGPVWEANHVWLILVVVLLFGAFPRAFAALSIALHVPLTLFLLGVVLRGSAFAFRSYDPGDARRRRWGLIFSLASAFAPVTLGACVGAIASGRIRVRDGVVEGGFFAPWLAPFPLVAGLFALSLCAFVAATYLAREAHDRPLQDDFRRRALAAGAAVGLLALVAFLLSPAGAPRVYEGLTARSWTWPFHGLTALAAGGAFWALWRRHYGLARVAVSAQTGLILLGWTLSHYPYLVVPDVTLANAAANPKTLNAVAIALAAGAPVLLPSLYLLFRIFKSSAPPASP